MRIIFTGILITIFSFSLFAENEMSDKTKTQIVSLLDKQVAAWNKGDLEQFMQTYWNSEKLVFIGSRGPTYGWQATLKNYKKGYPDKIAMGKLQFKILDISKIDRKTVFLIGRFELMRDIGNLSGHFSLVIQKIKGQWLIVSDHSSSDS